MARRLTIDDEMAMALAKRLTDEMLYRMGKPPRTGALHLGDEQAWQVMCADFDVGFFKIIDNWVSENADKQERRDGTAVARNITVVPTYGDAVVEPWWRVAARERDEELKRNRALVDGLRHGDDGAGE